MGISSKIESLRKIRFFHGLNDAELTTLGNLCRNRSFGVGEICQTEGQNPYRIHFILSGKVGAVLQIPNYSHSGSEIIIDILSPGELFGWSALIKGTPWSKLKVIDQTEVFYIDADDLIALCESNCHLGYILMKNLAALISSRLRHNRMSILNSIVAMKGEW
jgi:CRP/FNR family cyclic AMP-dependent transcriptional regulator